MKTKYVDNDNLALILVKEEDIGVGPVYTAITINIEDSVEKDCAFVKDYSENEGMMDALRNAGLIKEVLRYGVTGYVTVPLVRFNLEGIDEV